MICCVHVSIFSPTFFRFHHHPCDQKCLLLAPWRDLMSLLSLNIEQYSSNARTLKPNFALYGCAGAQPTFIVNRIVMVMTVKDSRNAIQTEMCFRSPKLLDQC